LPRSLISQFARLRVLGLALALLVGVSCTAGEMPLGTDGGGDNPPVAGSPPSTPPTDPGTGAPTDGGTGTPADSGTGTPGDSTGTPPDSTVTPADSGSFKSILLLCQVQEYAVTTTVIGPQGGQINVGMHSLRIPENALSEDVTITAEQIEGPESSVRLNPEGLRFAVPAELFLSYRNCASVQRSKRVVYTDELLNILESPLSLDIVSSSQVRGLINHFSRYAVAY
jgi:hypothetical protein